MVWPVKKVTPAHSALPVLKLMGRRVVLRPPQKADWGAWAAVRVANRAALEPWEPAWPEGCLSEEFFIRRLCRQAQDWEGSRAYSFLIFRNDDNRLIGGINLNHVALGAARSASLGYWLDQSHQGQGYMHESLSCVMQWAFEGLDLHRINAACLPANTASINVLRRLGFEEEGFARAYYRINGRWEDHVLFGRVRSAE